MKTYWICKSTFYSVYVLQRDLTCDLHLLPNDSLSQTLKTRWITCFQNRINLKSFYSRKYSNTICMPKRNLNTFANLWQYLSLKPKRSSLQMLQKELTNWKISLLFLYLLTNKHSFSIKLKRIIWQKSILPWNFAATDPKQIQQSKFSYTIDWKRQFNGIYYAFN